MSVSLRCIARVRILIIEPLILAPEKTAGVQHQFIHLVRALTAGLHQRRLRNCVVQIPGDQINEHMDTCVDKAETDREPRRRQRSPAGERFAQEVAEDQELLDTLLASVIGIAQGLQNTG